MVIKGTRCRVACNSGGIICEIIGILGGTSKKTARIGDLVVVAIKFAVPLKANDKKKVSSGEVHRAILTSTKYMQKDKDGICYKAGENTVILLNQKNELIGNNFKGWITKKASKLDYKMVKKNRSGIIGINANCQEVY